MFNPAFLRARRVLWLHVFNSMFCPDCLPIFHAREKEGERERERERERGRDRKKERKKEREREKEREKCT
jgi:hypothetical protein